MRRPLPTLAIVLGTLLPGADAASAAPLGEVTMFTNAGSNPISIAPGPDGNLWFTDNGIPDVIGRVTPAGTITEFTGTLGSNSNPVGITQGSDGNLWFTTSASGVSIAQITPSGTITEFSAGLNAGALPLGIARGSDGNVWFTDTGATAAIGRTTPSGTITEFSAGLNAGADPGRIAPGPDGNLWFTDSGTTDAIGRITPTGTITMFTAGLNAGAVMLGITPAPDGNIWFTDQGTTDAVGRITTTGTITMFTAGLNAGASLGEIAPGADGNLWFTDAGTTDAIGRIGVGASAASLQPPSVTGSGEQGTQQVCQGDRWATWAGEQPTPHSSSASPPGVQWLRNGTPLAGETGLTYTPGAADVGQQLSCTATVTYPLLNVTSSATSAGVTVIAQNAGPQGPAGLQGLQGPVGPQGPAGRDATVTCKPKGKRVKCKVAFAAVAGVRKARLSRSGVTYAEGKPVQRSGRLVLRFRSSRRLEPGRYLLEVVQHVDGDRVVTKSVVLVS